jgi:membrane protease YdiL (CAAX protease family)
VRKIKDFAMRQPFLFAIFLILSSLVVEILAGVLVVVLFRVQQADLIFAPIVLIITTLYLVFILWSFGWLKAAGVATLGSWKGWLAALVLLIYYLLELIYSFFGEFSFTVPPNAVSGLKVASVFTGAMFEEILFRGVILYALVCVWGTTRKGVLKAVLISALLFGGIHALNAIGGDPSEVLGQIVIALFESVWLGAIVLVWGSIWPVVFIHGVTDWVLQTKALSYADYHGTASSYTLAVLLGLPLVALGVWWILRAALRVGGGEQAACCEAR